jgi:hypothetical protein
MPAMLGEQVDDESRFAFGGDGCMHYKDASLAGIRKGCKRGFSVYWDVEIPACVRNERGPCEQHALNRLMLPSAWLVRHSSTSRPGEEFSPLHQASDGIIARRSQT